MDLSPRLYHWIVRPPWWTQRSIHDVINNDFTLYGKKVLDFGSGVGSNCSLVAPDKYLGVDVCPKRVRFASRKYPEYQFHQFSGGEIPTPRKYFDCIMVVAVLHHIDSPELRKYIAEFRRVLKPDGRVVVMEPCWSEQSQATNWFMKTFDKGRYIRNEQEYLELFQNQRYQTEVLRRFKRGYLYNELFFTAIPEY